MLPATEVDLTAVKYDQGQIEGNFNVHVAVFYCLYQFELESTAQIFMIKCIDAFFFFFLKFWFVMDWNGMYVAPHLTGLTLKVMVWLLEFPLIGSFIINHMKKQNKMDEVRLFRL